eukprot:5947269-Ditylum_brightwellii.AAC.1
MKTLNKKEKAAWALAQEEETKSKVEEELKTQLLSVKSTNDVVFGEIESELAEEIITTKNYQCDVELQKEK